MLIGLAIALGLIFCIVVGGVIAERIRRRRDGYIPAPTNAFDKASQIQHVPPGQFLETLNQGRGSGAPAI